MKFVIPIFIFLSLLSVSLSANEISPLSFEVLNKQNIKFKCMVPGKGTGCTKKNGYLIIKGDLTKYHGVNIINKSAQGDSIISYVGLRKGDRLQVSLIAHKPYSNHGALYLIEGKNKIILQVTGIKGQIVSEKEVALNTQIEWKY